MSQVATEKLKPEELHERKIPQIDPRNIKPNNQQNMQFNEWFIRAPAGLIMQDLQDYPKEVWKKVQSDRATGLRRFDRVLIVANDESWICEAIIAEATPAKVVLAGFRRIQLTAREEQYVTEDGNYMVRWDAHGYTCFRMVDGINLGLGYFDSLEAAKHKLLSTVYQKTTVGM